MTRGAAIAPATFALVFQPDFANAAQALDGARLSWAYALPFVGILLSIAAGPSLFHRRWEKHYDKVALFWSALVVLTLLISFDAATVTRALSQTLLLEYLPFVLLLLALYVTSGGIFLEGNLPDSAWTNTVLLGFGTLIASVIGTTGASMILIRPLIRANRDRRTNMHVVIFFIFLVGNIGGALSPLGDPPLFLGFLRGVDFFWTTKNLFLQTVLTAGLVLGMFCALDLYLHAREGGRAKAAGPAPHSPLRLHGTINFALIAIIVAAILTSANWQPGIAFTVLGSPLEAQNLMRDAVLVGVTLASLALTRRESRNANDFSWRPILEVALLFAGIFVCIAPVMAMLQTGGAGPFASLLHLTARPDGTPDPLAYFWLTGILSSFLDNAPTYLVFFGLAGGDAKTLMHSGKDVLQAISAAAVFMGANTYIGNAPNFMVYAVAREAGVKMPGFFGYMLWSGAVLLPIFALTGWLFFG